MNNFIMHCAGRILILWDPLKVDVTELEMTAQVIHCIITCKVTSISFQVSFVYAFHIIVARRSFWNNIKELGANCLLSWLIMGDFNNVLKFDEKCNGVDVTHMRLGL